MKNTPEPITDRQIFMIIIALLAIGWGIALLVDVPFFHRLLQYLSRDEEFDDQTVVQDAFATALHC